MSVHSRIKNTYNAQNEEDDGTVSALILTLADPPESF